MKNKIHPTQAINQQSLNTSGEIEEMIITLCWIIFIFINKK